MENNENQLPKKPKPAKPKGLPIQQLATKQYADIKTLTPEFKACFGDIDEAFDIIFFGDSSNGKTNAVAAFIDQLLSIFPGAKCNYISYEEGHGKTMRELLVHRFKLNEKHGNCLTLYENYSYEQLQYYIGRKQTAKIWVFDSIQASGLSYDDIAALKKKYVMGKAKKIFIFISWADGKLPAGATAKAVRYYANIKVRVEGFIGFIRSRYGTQKNYVVWEEGAKQYWLKRFKKMLIKK
ncbi:MAG TPA: hypothetical protein PKC39_08270 [Ferruginibacter sp.]|nr:hypothetical protein [Ferruginibacter sp.]HMP20937.1 hypothetical protein [Ferruginibacter sp.]